MCGLQQLPPRVAGMRPHYTIPGRYHTSTIAIGNFGFMRHLVANHIAVARRPNHEVDDLGQSTGFL